MASPSPLQLVENLALQFIARVSPPPWAVDEAQRRVVLLLNHVLMQEKAATERLTRQKGQVVLFQWPPFSIFLLVTPAGLLDLAGPGATPQLSLTLTDSSVLTIAQTLLRGDKPMVRIEGDVQLAAEVNWLVDNVGWDLEEDLARVVGDAPAHLLGEMARRMVGALRKFAGAGLPAADGPTPGAVP